MLVRVGSIIKGMSKGEIHVEEGSLFDGNIDSLRKETKK